MPDLPQRRNPRRFVGESYRDCVDRLAGELSATEKDRDALQARVEVLEAANAAVEEENDLLRDVIQQKHARIEELEDRVMTLEAQRADLLERCRQADRSKSLPELSTGEVRRALGIPLLGGPDA